MKRILTIITLFFVSSLFLLAQVPQKLSYQAVIRSAAGTLVTEEYLEVEISILQQSENGSTISPLYTEIHTVKTTSNGIINLEIGTGKTLNDFSKIDWSKGPYFIQSSTEVDGKSVMVNSQLLSVPYALYSEKAKYAESFDEATLQKIIDARVKAIVGNMNNGENQDDGKLPGRFSVSSSKSVRFSKGNLQYQASSNTWKFAENQFDTMEENNLHASETYTGWIDLFGWGTSGYNDKFPWMASITNTDYGNGLNDITGSEYDWGIYNAISNGGNQQGIWHLLTSTEWSYILSSRKNASNLKSNATVCGVKGYIILPDEFELPEELTFSPTTDYTTNTYGAKDWEKMENAGAVFLPNVKYKYKYSLSSKVQLSSSSSSYYWTSSCSSSSRAQSAFEYYFDRHNGLAVRLVTE